MRCICFVLVVSMVGALGACTHGAKSSTEAPLTVKMLTPAEQARRVPVYDGRTGQASSWDELLRRSLAADIVVLGENHGHPLGLAAASALWDDLCFRSRAAALALKFFERDEQIALDDYLAGITDEPTFRKASHRTESSYPPGHRAMVAAAKSHGCPVIASNAPRRYVRLARTDGFERLKKLTPEQRRLFRIPDDLPGPDSRYRKDFGKVMGEAGGPSHGSSESKDPASQFTPSAAIDASFRSQSMWDWTMAESCLRAYSGGSNPVVQIVGRFHSDFDGGLIQAIQHLRAGTRVVTVSFVQRDGPPAPDASEDERDLGRADFVIYVGAETQTAQKGSAK